LTESLSRQNFVVHPHLLSSYDPIITYANFVYDPREASSSQTPSTNFTPCANPTKRETPSNHLEPWGRDGKPYWVLLFGSHNYGVSGS